jgi:5'-3' exoribonuclease 2
MPKSNFIHKSMLLRGVVFPPPALTPGDIETTKSKAARSGRAHGGVPLNGDGRGRNSFNYSSSNQYQSHNSQRHNSYNQNPFPVPPPGWQPPAPGTGGFARGPPPPPAGYYDRNQASGPGYPQNNHSYGYNNRGGYGDSNNRRGNGDGYRGGGNNGWRGNGDSYRR